MGQLTSVSVARKTVTAILLSFVAFVVTISVAYAAQYGTYSSLTFNRESGDLNGYEVEFIPTNNGLKSVVQVAEGEVTDIYIVDVKEGANNSLSFEFPQDGSGKMIVFVGKIHDGKLEGTITLPAGEVHVILRKGVGYWNQR